MNWKLCSKLTDQSWVRVFVRGMSLTRCKCLYFSLSTKMQSQWLDSGCGGSVSSGSDGGGGNAPCGC